MKLKAIKLMFECLFRLILFILSLPLLLISLIYSPIQYLLLQTYIEFENRRIELNTELNKIKHELSKRKQK